MKRLFARKTKNIKNPVSKAFVQHFKDLQENSEKLAKQARKIKQTLKSDKDIRDPGKGPAAVRKATDELLRKNGSFLDTYLATMDNLIDIIGQFEFEDAKNALNNAKTSLGKAKAASASISDKDVSAVTQSMAPVVQELKTSLSSKGKKPE